MGTKNWWKFLTRPHLKFYRPITTRVTLETVISSVYYALNSPWSACVSKIATYLSRNRSTRSSAAWVVSASLTFIHRTHRQLITGLAGAISIHQDYATHDLGDPIDRSTAASMFVSFCTRTLRNCDAPYAGTQLV